MASSFHNNLDSLAESANKSEWKCDFVSNQFLIYKKGIWLIQKIEQWDLGPTDWWMDARSAHDNYLFGIISIV